MVLLLWPRFFSPPSRRQKRCSDYWRRNAACCLLAILAIGLSFDACPDQSPVTRAFPSIFVASFTSRKYLRLTPPSWSFFIVHDQTLKSSRHEKVKPVRRQKSKMNRMEHPNHGSVTALASAHSSPSTKPPAPTDWVILEEYPMISTDGIDPYRILENGILNSSDEHANKYLVALKRLNATQYNLTLPIALMSLDSHRYPTLSNARKACRQGKIVLSSSATTSTPNSSLPQPVFRKGLVGDRVYPLDCIARRELYKNLPTTNSSSSTTSYETLGDGFVKSKFQKLHVAYEDDYMAIVVKPAGLLVHPQGKNGGWGRKNNVLNALPYFLRRPPDPAPIIGNTSSNNADEKGADDGVVLKQPVPVHRLDFATSGLLVAAKTKGASRLLAQEFEYRKAQKTYTAMVYGVPIGNSKSSTVPSFFGPKDTDGDFMIGEAGTPAAGPFETKKVNKDRGDDDSLSDTDDFEDDVDGDIWNLADCFLDQKRARTRWRLLGSYNCSVPIRYHNGTGEKDGSIVAMNVPISIVEMKPKTGRYHQLRRTMAWLYKTPIVGDPVYGTNFVEENFLPDNAEIIEQQQLRDYRASLMLCSNKIDVAHPYFNTAAGRLEWDNTNTFEAVSKTRNDASSSSSSSSSSLYKSEDGIVRVSAAIQLPKKFTKFISMMERRRKRT